MPPLSARALSRLRPPARRIAQGAYAALSRQRLQRRVVLFESFGGSAMTGNPYALYAGMRSDARFADHSFVWAVQAPLQHQVAEQVRDDDAVRVVKYRSPAYFRALATVPTLINNVTFPALFRKRPDQFYLNTWHGTPLKRMGIDARDGADIQNTVANFRAADVLLSTSGYMTQVMYEGAYGLSGAGGQIQELGYPRIDMQFDRVGQQQTRAALAAAGFSVSGRRVILYAPTWRATSAAGIRLELRDVAQVIKQSQAALDPTRAVVLLRLHDSVATHAKEVPELASCLVAAEVRTNALLGITDTLVTDYSSIFFDYLATGSQIVFYTPDAPAYGAVRGLYLGPTELPGPSTSSRAELTRWLSDPPQRGFVPADQARARYCPREDGAATARVLDLIVQRNRFSLH